MKQIMGLLLCSFLVITSCQKEIDGSIQRPAGVDSTGNERVIEYQQSNSADNRDSFVTYYKFDINGLLMEEKYSQWSAFRHFYRDGKGRVTTYIQRMVSNNDTIFTFVHYKDENSGTIAYTISHAGNIPNKILDSIVYIYEGGKLVKNMGYSLRTGTAFLGYYYTWSYDTKNNISLLQLFTKDSSGNFTQNIGYEFLYDDKINPFYTTDQVRQLDEWCWSSSPNNIVKHINHYPPNYPFPDDDVNYTYTYDLSGKPITSVKSGPSVDTVYATYKYQ